MTQIVEARSLGVLTTLASDPPLYPYNPTHSPHGPLALYIVRVPGSKDVFLTPLKPRDKVVNAQDVQSSLYYVHIDEPEDAALINVEAERPTFSSFDNSKPNAMDRSQVARKPLPTPPMSPIDVFEETSRDRPYPLAPNVPKRKPVVPSISSAYLDLPQIPTRPSHRKSASFDSSHDSDPFNYRRPLPGRMTSQQSDINQYSAHNPTDSTMDGGPGAPSSGNHFGEPSRISLTLIRRDPTSGAQWNVAKIYDPPVQEISSETLAHAGTFRAKRAGAPLFIDIINPGYSKFMQLDNARPISRNSAESAFLDSDNQNDGVFRRRLWMDGSRFADHSYTQRSQPSMESGRPSRRSLQLSAQDFKVSPRAVVDRRSKGYSFRSPWGGKCDFATGVSGRSLKCKYHPEGSRGQAAEVSELRFNLPTAGGSSTTSAKRSSFVPRVPLHGHTASVDSWDAEMPDELPNYFDEKGDLNLSLGQERAGGGFHGKRAKLGKLIIEEMGLRMLDLTVAANMALWWRAYERA